MFTLIHCPAGSVNESGGVVSGLTAYSDPSGRLCGLRIHSLTSADLGMFSYFSS
jgi:hypothetical protein